MLQMGGLKKLNLVSLRQLILQLPIIIEAQMEEIDRQFWQPVRSFLIRYAEYNRERGTPPHQLEEFEQAHARMLAGRELKETVINRLAAIDLKSDYHNLIILTLLQDLAKWSQEYYPLLKLYPGPLECILSQSIAVLNGQQQYHTIVPKQNELICLLLPHPNTMENLEQFKVLYRRLKDVKEFYPSAIRDHQKQCFLKAVEECIQRAAEVQNVRVLEFIFNNIFNELENLEETHEYVSQRLKIVKKITKVLWVFHEEILYKVAFLLMRFSYLVLNNPHLFNYVLPIYEQLLERLAQRPSIAPLLLYRHLVFNNINRILTDGGSPILLEILLCQLSNLFRPQTLKYFMQNYDWNYLELPICQQSLHLLYEYTQNRANEKKVEFQLAKAYITRIHAQIRSYLEGGRGVSCEQSKWKFYQLKRREFQELLQEMNNKPKRLFKRIQAAPNQEVKEALVSKYVRLIKKTAHLNNRSMIDIFATDHPVSAELFAAYVEVVLKQCRQHNLQQFMRLFTSNFFLTGQSQQIGRVMDTITQLYFRHQEEDTRILRSSDATYTFANAILILNTDLHNPKNEEKISEENFIKMCRKINDNEDLPLEVLKKTYANIKRNKINTFRDRGDMLGISVSNWLNMCMDYDSLPPAYYDPELALLDAATLEHFINDLLSTIIDQKETAKLELLVERFVYDDKVYECEIIETLRRAVEKKPHLPLHVLTRIMELANFKSSKPTERLLSYYWLASSLAATFPSLLPTAPLCQFLAVTWGLRAELQDNLHLRQVAEFRRVRQCVRAVTKREAKKSIMDMFSNFLSFKESDEEPDVPPNDFNRRNNFKALSNALFDILKYSQSHRTLAVDFFIEYIHNEEAKQYEEFVSCLFLTFNLLYYVDGCQKVGEDLFYELLGAKESSITKRLTNLGKKDSKLHAVLISYCKFWILKLLLKEYTPAKLASKANNNYDYILNKALEYLEKVDKEVLNDLLKELSPKTTIPLAIYEAFQKAIKKVYTNNTQEVQFFFDKFSQNETQAEIPSHPIKQVSSEEEKKSPTLTSEPKQPTTQAEQKKEGNIQQQKQEPAVQALKSEPKQQPESKQVKEERQESAEQAKQQTTIIKQGSINQLQEYVNPDQEINKIEQEIEMHLKSKVEAIPQRLQQTEEKAKQEVKHEQQEMKQGQQSPSIPVVMF